ncbi:PP2C family protein-serine/threonine phosphatase [Streptomyces sp. NBC_01794]|uniref:PP2C family protein-serine/threonine phosphatase n=1 Tax=Streptomyces sp. NBC_01794 TaxID=2975942 RepID=UPI0030900A79|nr:serine/threonine-protein phosphatase [Streptomyces sp. NBC_01794]
MGQREQDGGTSAHRLVLALPSLMIIGGLVFDLLTPSEFTASPLFAAAPLIAAPFFSWLATLLTGMAAVAGVVGLHIYNGTLSQTSANTELFTVITVAGLALFINRVVRLSGQRLASARVIAENAQRAVLPTPLDRIGGLRIAARYEAAQKDALVGGDLFAVQDTPHGVRLVVGDVRGKGMEAVEAVAVVIGAFREAAEQERSLEGVAARLERALTREGTRRDSLDVFEGFTTAVLAEVPRGAAGVRVVNRGHPEPLVLYPDGDVDRLRPTEHALPLGMGDLGSLPELADEYPFPAGATLLLYTDGLSEARNADDVFYDPGERLGGRHFPGPEELLDALLDDVRRYTGGGTNDDMALLAVGRPANGRPERGGTVPVVKEEREESGRDRV